MSRDLLIRLGVALVLVVGLTLVARHFLPLEGGELELDEPEE